MKKIFALVAGVVLVAALAGVGLIIYHNIKEKYAPSEQVLSLTDYYSVPDGEAMIILDGDVFERNALYRHDMTYIDLDMVKSMYTHRFFYVPEENSVFYSTAHEIYEFTPGETVFLLNRQPTESVVPIVELKNDTVYVCTSFLERCGMTCSTYTEPARLLIASNPEGYLCADVAKATRIRAGKDIKADILKEVQAPERMRFIDGGGIRENGFVKVMSEDGVRGYIEENALSESYYFDPELRQPEADEYSHIRYSGNIYLGWQLTYSTDSTPLLNKVIAESPEVNVVAPTWFYLNDTEGNMNSYASQEYVDLAHSNGIKVWGTFKNDEIEGVFSASEDSHRLLSVTAHRNSLTDRIVGAALEYGLDGVNIDFELLKVETGVYFIQFLRELSVACRENGICLSVDDYVPMGYNAYYDLKEQAEIIDYIVIMGYDEHYAGGGQAGSVSSLNWFKQAAVDTAALAEPAGVIMGVPFYTRLWREEMVDGEQKLYIDLTPGMDEAAKVAANSGAEKVWSKDCGQYYIEYKKDSATCRMWLEDAKSLEQKVLAVRELDMAGIAAWKLGDESAGTWGVIKNAFEGDLTDAEEADAE